MTLATMFDESRCATRSRYCQWRPSLDNDDVRVEYCIHCHRSVTHKKIGGEFANIKLFFNMHARDFAQPFGPSKDVFGEIYGKKEVKKFESMAKEKKVRQDRQEGLQGEFDHAIELGNMTSMYFKGAKIQP